MNDQSESLLEKAEYLTEIGRWNEAIPLALKVLARDPQNFQASAVLSLCHYHLKNYDKALEFAESAIAAAPDEEWGHRLRSIALTGLGKHKEAVKSAEEAVRLAPYEPFALQVLANVYLEVRQARKALEAAEQMRELAPESETTFFTLGNVHLARGNNHEAENCFRDALRINPNFADARNNLGVALLRQRENNSAFNKPSSISIFQTADKEEEIHTHFSEAMRIEPGNEVAAENLRHQFDYLLSIYGFLVFAPFLSLAFLITPGWIVLLAFLGVLGILKQFWEVFQKRRNLSPELRLFLKATRKNPRQRVDEFFAIVKRFFKKTWKPHLVAALALCLRLLYGMPKFSQTGWNDYLAYILLFAAAVWLISELRKD